MTQTRVHFVGAGPGDPELLTVRAARLLAQADVVVYPGSLTPKAVVSIAKPQAVLHDSAAMTLEETHAVIMDAVRQGKSVVRLQAGDPALYGTIGEQTALLEQHGVAYDVTPGVTAASAAAAALGLPVTGPQVTQTLVLTRTAGRTPMPEGERLRDLARHQCALAVYLSSDKPEDVRQQLLDGGYPPDTPLAVAHRVGWPEEELHLSCVADFPHIVRSRNLTRQTLFLVLPGLGRQARSKLYDPQFSHGFRQADPT